MRVIVSYKFKEGEIRLIKYPYSKKTYNTSVQRIHHDVGGDVCMAESIYYTANDFVKMYHKAVEMGWTPLCWSDNGSMFFALVMDDLEKLKTLKQVYESEYELEIK